VAVIGSVYASLYRSHIQGSLPAAVPQRVVSILDNSIGAAQKVADHLNQIGQPVLAQRVSTVSTDAFLHGLSVGCLVGAGVAIAGAVMAAVFLPAQPPSAEAPVDLSDSVVEQPAIA
jgi:hypothetical protein